MTDTHDAAETIPADLLAAFRRYEEALLADDLDVLDDCFEDEPGTMRGDAGGLLVGHDAISAFRGVRGGVPARRIERIEYRPLGDDAALLVSISRYASGGTGLQTQLWRRADGRWRIAVAHVTPRSQPLDRSVWRNVGDPFWHGAPAGPLRGLTVAAKDLFAMKGRRIGAGNPTFLAEARPEATTAPAVADLLNGGASLRGVARTDEFAYSIAGDNPHYGTPPNGAVPGALPGGSSSGPASAVATGQAEVGLATDTAGSIRVPASYQGLWGLRTTHGLVPRQGLLPLAQSFDTIGWLTRDGATLQRVADWCLGYEGSESTESVFGPADDDLPWRLLVAVEAVAAAEPDTQRAFLAMIEQLTSRPDAPEVREVSLGSLDAYYDAFRVVQGAEAWRNNGAWLLAHPGAVGAAVDERFRLAAEITAEQEAEARATAARLRDDLRALVRDGILILPTVPGPAPMRTRSGEHVAGVRAATLRMTTPAAIGGLPALSAPLLTVASRLGPAPVGVGLISAEGTDVALVRAARRLEDALS
ncbi:MAG: DUF3225 domain-containing protein [Arachnia sp.]